MEHPLIIYTADDFKNFREWLNLNLESITWQGRFVDDFEDFWKLFFIEGLSLNQVSKRFRYAFHEVELGPLISWFKWLNNKFLIFTFIKCDITFLDLAHEADIHITNLATILREYFIHVYPQLDDYFSEVFHITHVTSVGLNLTYKELQEIKNLEEQEYGGSRSDVMTSLEITLYDEFKEFIKKIKKNLYHYEIDLKNLEANTSWKKYFSFLVEAGILALVSLVIIVAIIRFNEWHEGSLSKKISIYNLKVPWITEKFKTKEDVELAKKELNPKVKDLGSAKSQMKKIVGDREIKESSKFGTESDVILTSWDSLPKDFSVIELEKSEYEEKRKGAFRSSRFGSRKVYRVMVNSVEVGKTRARVNKLLDKYKVTQADNVKPGMYVPGGVYYNLFIPTEYLKEFLKQVDEVGEVVIYENRARVRNPPGKNKIFVWIKSL